MNKVWKFALAAAAVSAVGATTAAEAGASRHVTVGPTASVVHPCSACVHTPPVRKLPVDPGPGPGGGGGGLNDGTNGSGGTYPGPGDGGGGAGGSPTSCVRLSSRICQSPD
jgi:hypothetical protein